MRFGLILATALLSLPLQAAPAAAQAADQKYSMHPSWITEEGYGDVVVYLADTFSMSTPAAPEPLNVVTIRRSNPGDARNSPKDDLDALFKYLKANSGFTVRDFVALASSRDLIRFYFRGDYSTLAAKFDFPRATMGAAAPQDWARLRAIGIPDFSRFIAKSASSQAAVQQKLLGDAVPAPENRTLELKLMIDAGGPARGQSVVAAMRQKRFDNVTTQVTLGADNRSLTFDARMRFSEALVQQVMNGACEEAARAGGRCVDWGGRFQTITINPAPAP
jgi:hypothetical protein